MKSSPEPVWKQHRRIKEEQGRLVGGGSSGRSSGTAESAATGKPGGAGGTRESQIETGRKLTQTLGRASTEGKFNKEELLEALQKVKEGRANRGRDWIGGGNARRARFSSGLVGWKRCFTQGLWM